MDHTTADAQMEQVEAQAYAAGKETDEALNPHPPGVFHDGWERAYARGRLAARAGDAAAGPREWGWHGMGYDE